MCNNSLKFDRAQTGLARAIVLASIQVIAARCGVLTERLGSSQELSTPSGTCFAELACQHGCECIEGVRSFNGKQCNFGRNEQAEMATRLRTGRRLQYLLNALEGEGRFATRALTSDSACNQAPDKLMLIWALNFGH